MNVMKQIASFLTFKKLREDNEQPRRAEEIFGAAVILGVILGAVIAYRDLWYLIPAFFAWIGLHIALHRGKSPD